MGRHNTKLGHQSRAQTRPPLPYPVNDGRVAPAVQEAAERRSQRRRSRLAALSAATVLAIGGAAGMSMATADEPEASGGGEIVFSGSCGTLGLLSATSSPDSSEVTVVQGSQVRYRNELGTKAKLHVGDEVYDIGSGATQVFVMNRSAEVAMVPACAGLFADYESAQVRVVEPQSEGVPADEEEPAAEAPAVHDLPAPDEGGAELEAPSGDRPAGGGDSAAGRQGHGEDAAALDEAEDAEDEAAAEDEVNAFGPPAGSEEDTAAGGDFAGADEEFVAVDPKAVADGANGLLALVAIICLVGVAAAVARTLLKQRAMA
ncbi:hypothetical protein [Glycomyces sp. NRRL B-16210]|uniref:hypothetical protein n=1 Tax=Glycomyces sp. NRRL B-16210 TaxID=1463821 RepID=UPI0010E2ED2F|nr:hypothetical protein [Glycomyces sp. NRRL B-16210]